MFNRRLSHKPSKDFLSHFKQNYSDALPSFECPIEATSTLQPSQTPILAYDPNHFQGTSGRNNGLFSTSSFELSPEWRTSGLIDHEADGFHDVNQPGGYWPPTPQDSSLYGGGPAPMHSHHAAFGMETPVSGSSAHHPGFPLPGTQFTGQDFMGPQHVDSYSSTQSFVPPQSLAPQELHYSTAPLSQPEAQTRGLHLSEVSLSQGYVPSQPSPSGRASYQMGESIGPKHVLDAMKQFRFRTILKAQTAMIKRPFDIPVTYLNKSQTYNIQIQDSFVDPGLANPSLKYRTAVRISFEDDAQRKNPASSWQLWHEGRGTNEANKRGGRKPRAVEFAKPDQSHPEQRSNLQSVAEHFDGFSFLWSPNASNVAACNVQLRFNFLSTDFSHSKGVKGVPVRLCAKTEIVEGQETLPPSLNTREISFCAVKIFRDHGAERKLANDKAHIDKLVDKFTAQAEQADAGVKEGAKRRRSDSFVTARPTKAPKHKRTWSVSSSESLDEQQEAPPEDELLVRIRSLKNMPDSVRPVSAFYLRGEDQDDLDSYPVILAANSPLISSPAQSCPPSGPPSLRTETTQTTSRDPTSETPVSRSPSALRVKSDSAQLLQPTADVTSSTPTLQSKSPIKLERVRSAPQQLASPPSTGSMNPPRAEKLLTSTPSSQLSQALDIDAAYQPPSERKTRAVAEFFMKPSLAWQAHHDDNYRAIYLQERTLRELVRAIALKCGVEPSSIIRTIRVNDHISITAEDDMVEQMREQQDFLADLDFAEDTHDSAAQFMESHDEPSAESDYGVKYKLTLRF